MIGAGELVEEGVSHFSGSVRLEVEGLFWRLEGLSPPLECLSLQFEGLSSRPEGGRGSFKLSAVRLVVGDFGRAWLELVVLRVGEDDPAFFADSSESDFVTLPGFVLSRLAEED